MDLKRKIDFFYSLYVDLLRDIPHEVGILTWINPQELSVDKPNGTTTQKTIDTREWYTRNGQDIASSIKRLGGMYFPLMVGKGVPKGLLFSRTATEEGNELFVDEGRHRARALHKIKQTRPVLCLYHRDGFSYDESYFTDSFLQEIKRPFEKPIEVVIPIVSFFWNERITQEHLTKHFPDIYSAHEDESLVVMKIDNAIDFKTVLFKFARYISNMFVSHIKIFGEEVLPKKEIIEEGHLPSSTLDESMSDCFANLRMVEIEIHSKCNRKCSWCPNSFVDRTFQTNMNSKVFEKTIYELYRKGFKGTISFSRYNEPLLDEELLIERIAFIKKYFKDDVKIVFNTNGDYLNSQTLSKVKVDEMTVMDYDCKGMEWCVNKIKECNYEIVHTQYPYIYFQYSDIHLGIKRIGVYVVDWPRHGEIVSRGDSLKKELKVMKWKNNREERKTPCFEPKYFVGVDYNGNVTPCCEVRSDIEKHSCMILGNLHSKSLEEIWFSDKSLKLRKVMEEGLVEQYPEPCKKCQKCEGRYTREKPGIRF